MFVQDRNIDLNSLAVSEKELFNELEYARPLSDYGTPRDIIDYVLKMGDNTVNVSTSTLRVNGKVIHEQPFLVKRSKFKLDVKMDKETDEEAPNIASTKVLRTHGFKRNSNDVLVYGIIYLKSFFSQSNDQGQAYTSLFFAIV